jgi:hypothetical protein
MIKRIFFHIYLHSFVVRLFALMNTHTEILSIESKDPCFWNFFFNKKERCVQGRGIKLIIGQIARFVPQKNEQI